MCNSMSRPDRRQRFFLDSCVSDYTPTVLLFLVSMAMAFFLRSNGGNKSMTLCTIALKRWPPCILYD